MDRGILSTIYVNLKRKTDTGRLREIYRKHYEGDTFVRICGEKQYPSTSQVKGSNFCDIGMRVDQSGRKAIIVSVIDNLVKGASGQAVQNMNVMMGFDETLGLMTTPVFP